MADDVGDDMADDVDEGDDDEVAQPHRRARARSQRQTSNARDVSPEIPMDDAHEVDGMFLFYPIVFVLTYQCFIVGNESSLTDLPRSANGNLLIDQLHPLARWVVDQSVVKVFEDMVFEDSFKGSTPETKGLYYRKLLVGVAKSENITEIVTELTQRGRFRKVFARYVSCLYLFSLFSSCTNIL